MTAEQEFDAFISYSRHDRDWALELRDGLQSRGLRIWLDEDQIAPGSKFAKAISDGINGSKSIVVLISPESMNSGWVEDEFHQALNLANSVDRTLKLIPVVLRGAEIPGFLQTRQHVDFQDETTFDEKLDKLCWGITNEKAITVSSDHVLEGGQVTVKVPYFRPEDLVTGEDFINRDEELADALDLVQRGARFMLVGEARVGKTCFCEQLMLSIRNRSENNILATRVDLEVMQPLTYDTILGQTLIAMASEMVESLFDYDGVFADISASRSPGITHLPKTVQDDPAFQQLRSVWSTIEDKIYFGQDLRPKPLAIPLFVQYTKDLLRIMNRKGRQRFIMFYDEANKLPEDFAIGLFARNAKSLAASNLTSVVVASCEMSETLRTCGESFGDPIRLRPFEHRRDMKRLLARYYFGDSSSTENLPIKADALDMIWRTSQGIPFYLQHIFAACFKLANREQASVVSGKHVRSAIQGLVRSKPRFFDKGFLDRL